MHPKWSQNEGHNVRVGTLGASENGLEIQTRVLWFWNAFWNPFGTLFDAFWASWEPFGHPQPFGLPEAVLSAAFGSFYVRRELDEIPPRTCRGSAENPPRTNQEPAV